MTDNEQKTINKYVAFILSNDVSMDFLVQMAELTISCGELLTIDEYATKVGKTYQGVIKTTQPVSILGKKYLQYKTINKD